MLARIGEMWRGSAARERAHAPARGVTSRGGARSVVAVAVTMALASAVACGSDAPGTSSSSGSVSGSAGTGSADVAGAEAALAPYTGRPSGFPVSEFLSRPLPKGTKFAFLQCSTPFCALAGQSLAGAVAAIGGTFTKVDAGATATTSQAAAASVLALKPDAVFVTVNPSLYGGGLKKLSDAGITVASISIVKDVKPFGISFNYIGADEVAEDGRLMADWVIARHGAEANAVFYGLPAFDFSEPLQRAFEAEMKEKCPSCTVRTVDIDVATIGTRSPGTVVADLEAHPDTNVAVFVSMQIAQGLPAAMRAAGLSGITTIGRGATPANLADIRNGGLTAALAIDTPVSTWTAVDSAARLLLGDLPTASENAGELDKQILQKEDITFDPARGWTGYPDFPSRFAKLWLTK